eukprot:Protomagalhaensia_wolfi_Nauph_80__6209@NODE_928_length_1875_cov_16_924292_g700_i0_p1_GENE_NODE_928_length_1875_cov_16_924292_g700_i0NODE_928_length_1875_cov_16_924292_g700_i0_p1_ORF_typecomplete_len582_score192_11DUF3458_C/PF17432_2/7_7e03DUF3458_C/PF17432_2/1_1e76Peptidase_M1/PF01433_20/8_5e33DUF3458/PF11940_8/2e23_NODE_928_length_1875_cov_16_924292_g700_i01831748
MSHPIRPESYQTIDNFYTSTVYEKGSHVIGMLRTLVGVEGFRRGTDLYFKKYDGKAISCDEFVGAIAEANNRDFSQFALWYSQRGTPVLKIKDFAFDAESRQYRLTIEQQLPSNADPEGGEPKAMHIPILLGLIGRQSKNDLVGTKLLELTQFSQTFAIDGVTEDCVPSFLRDFSAPVKVQPFLSREDLAFLAAYDTDPFCVWDAAQTIFKAYILARAAAIKAGEKVDDQLPEYMTEIFKEGLKNRFNDQEFITSFLAFPAVASLYSEMKPAADPLVLYQVIHDTRDQIAESLREEINTQLEQLIQISRSVPFRVTKEDVGRRSLESLLLGLASRVATGQRQKAIDRIVAYYESAQSYNDREVAAHLICGFEAPERDQVLERFYNECKDDPNMLDDWFRTQALGRAPDTPQRVRKLLEHPDFKDTTTPNRWRALIGGACANPTVFHQTDGDGYRMVAAEIARFDKFNGYTAALVAKRLIQFAYFDEPRRGQMIATLRSLLEGGLSKNTNEVVTTALKTVDQ